MPDRETMAPRPPPKTRTDSLTPSDTDADADLIELVRTPSITKRYSTFGESEILSASTETLSTYPDTSPERSSYESQPSKPLSRQSKKQSADLSKRPKQSRVLLDGLKIKVTWRTRRSA